MKIIINRLFAESKGAKTQRVYLTTESTKGAFILKFVEQTLTKLSFLYFPVVSGSATNLVTSVFVKKERETDVSDLSAKNA